MTETTGERGAASVEFALVVPALVMLLCLVVGGARVWFARASAEQIAAAASRSASVQRSAVDARRAALSVAGQQSTSQGLRCQPLDVQVDAAGFATPVGTPARVGVRVRCVVMLADILVPGWPGSLTLTAEAQSVLDRYRGRG